MKNFTDKYLSILKQSWAIFNNHCQRKNKVLALLSVLTIAVSEVVSIVIILFLIMLCINTAKVIEVFNNLNLSLQVDKPSELKFIIFSFGISILTLAVRNVILFYANKRLYTSCYQIGSSISEQVVKEYFKRGLLYFNITDHTTLWRNAMINPFSISLGGIFSYFSIVSELIIMFCIFGFIIVLNGSSLLMLVLVIAPALLIVYLSLKKKLELLGRQNEAVYNSTNYNITNLLNGFLDISMNNKENYFLSKYMKSRNKLNANEAVTNTINILPPRIVETLVFLALSIFFISTYLQFNGNNEQIIKTISLFVGAIFRVIPGINKINMSLLNIKNSSYAFDIIAEYNLLKKIEVNSKKEKEEDTSKINFNRLSLSNVTYTYPKTTNGLKNLSFNISGNEHIGIVGKSGAGKSTFVKIILKELVAQSGEILLDNIELHNINKFSWCNSIGYVSQAPFMMNEPLWFNITFDEESNIDYNKLNTAIKLAQLTETVNQLSNGIHEVLGEKGDKLSGGQKQRVAIARALYKNPKLIIFDEATSALDLGTEQKILESIKLLKKEGIMAILISHRVSTLKNCDSIYQIQDGAIVNTYNYDEIASNISSFKKSLE